MTLNMYTQNINDFYYLIFLNLMKFIKTGIPFFLFNKFEIYRTVHHVDK